MSRKLKDRGKLKHFVGRQRQKLTDDYTGFYVNSDQTTYDYKGMLVSAAPKTLGDPKPIPEYKVTIPVEISPPFVRTPGQIELVPVAAAWEVYWDTDNDYWDLSEFIY